MFTIIEILFLTILLFTLYYLGAKEKRKKEIILVKNLRHMCNTDIERKLYDGLIEQGIYVSPSVRLGSCSIPIALEQFKIAIFSKPKQKTTLTKQLTFKCKELYLRSTGWKVLVFSQETWQTDFEKIIEKIVALEVVQRNRVSHF